MIRKFLLVLALGLFIPYSMGAALEGVIKQPVRILKNQEQVTIEVPKIEEPVRSQKKIPNVAWF